MARTISLGKLEGAKDLERVLGALGKDVATRIGRKAVRDPAQVLATVLRLTAPYRPGRRDRPNGADYGHLRDNLKVVSVRAKKPGLLLYRVTTGDAFWGNFLEFGTVNMPARPWMRPQVDAMKGEIVDIQVSTLSLGIERAAKKQARRFAAVNATGRNG
jgi:HK97 gp10 family phage protein